MRVRVLSLFAAAALFGLAITPASATSEGHTYLALGDSVPFGFNPLVSIANANNFTGWPEIVAQRLNIEDANAACPGEATGGFLSLSSTNDNGCQGYRFFLKAPLHVSYSGTQMAFAESYLRSHPRTRLVTLMLGANDAFHLQTICGRLHPGDPAGQAACVMAGLPGVLATEEANLSTIFANIRDTGYTGLIVALTYYSLNYADPASVAGAQALNLQMITAARGHDVVIASGFDAWAPTAGQFGGDSCAAGLLILKPSGTCDVHPTPKGRDLLAAAVVQAVADSCPAESAIGCLDRNRG